MKVIDAAALDYKTLNEVLRQPEHDYVIEGCCGQRFIGAESIAGNSIDGNIPVRHSGADKALSAAAFDHIIVFRLPKDFV